MTVKVAGTLRDTFPFCPVTIAVKLPTGVLPLVVRVITAELPVVQVALKLGVTPLGKLEALKQTWPLNPPVRLINTRKDTVKPLVMVGKPELADIVKSPLPAS